MELNYINESKRRKLDRPITGIIQEDRIWEQWYDQEALKKELPKMSQKEYLKQCIQNDPNRIILNNRNKKKFTVNEFLDKINRYEKAFTAMNLKEGDVICTIGLQTPEMYFIKYAATSLGLITSHLNILDANITDDEVNRLYLQLKNVEPKMIFTLDILEDRIFEIVNHEDFSNAFKVSMPFTYSTPFLNPEKMVLSLKTLKDFLSGKKILNKVSLNEFLFLGEKINEEELNEIYYPGMPCNISFTSGTTGINKAVVLSHDANNALPFQQKIGEFGYEKGTTNLALVFPFLAFWDADIVHAVLCQEGENIIETSLDFDKIPKYFKKYQPNMGIWSQYLWSSLLTLPDNELKEATKNLKHAIIGGARCEVNAAKLFYAKTGVIQTCGFGATEVNTAFSVPHPNCMKLGTAGIPQPFNNVKIVDESFHDVTYNVPGRLFITGPALMNGYYKREDLTKKVLYTDEKGITWYDTGDYAVVDDDGCLTVLDRYMGPIEITCKDKVIKVNPLDIAEIIRKNPNTKDIKITCHENNQKLVLHISFDTTITNASMEEAIESLLDTIKEALPEEEWPSIINVYDEFPKTPVGKSNYPLLQLTGEELIHTYISNNKLIVLKPENVSLTRKRK